MIACHRVASALLAKMEMKKLITFSMLAATLFLLSHASGFAQRGDVIDNGKSRPLRHSRFLAIGRSSFDVNGFPSSPDYASLEMRLGAGIAKLLGKNFELKSGVTLGLKFKRKSYFYGPSKQFTNEPWVSLNLDETASSRNHLFIESPVALQFKLPKTGVRLKGGLNFRFWAPNNASVDVLSFQPEIGILGGISSNVGKRINVGVEHYYGLTDIWGGSSRSNPGLIWFYVRNQFTQIVIERSF